MRPDTPLVAAQAVSIAGLAWPGRARWDVPRALTGVAIIATVAGGALALAGSTRHGRTLTPRVAPPPGAGLHTAGAYAVSRNPIYAGLALAAGGVAVLRRRPEPLASWAALVVVLDRKARDEERHLAARFGEEYERYRERTPRLLGLPRHADGGPPLVR